MNMDFLQKFQDLLKEFFQFETSDLDFGIYRILNYKREHIEKFINEDLRNRVEAAFAKYKDQKLIDIDKKFEEEKEKLIAVLGVTRVKVVRDICEDIFSYFNRR